MKRILLAASIAAAFSGACGSSGVGSPAAPTMATAARDLSGSSWRLESIDGRPALAGVRVTAVFSPESRVAGSAGCNSYFGSAGVQGEKLEVGNLGATRMYCGAEGVMPQEQAYLAALGAAKAWRATGSRLELGPEASVVTLVFRAE